MIESCHNSKSEFRYFGYYVQYMYIRLHLNVNIYMYEADGLFAIVLAWPKMAGVSQIIDLSGPMFSIWMESSTSHGKGMLSISH